MVKFGFDLLGLGFGYYFFNLDPNIILAFLHSGSVQVQLEKICVFRLRVLNLDW